jgi:hypothetical protein
MKEKMKVTAFAIIMGRLSTNNPNKSHKKVPKVKREYMYNDIPEVFFV